MEEGRSITGLSTVEHAATVCRHFSLWPLFAWCRSLNFISVSLSLWEIPHGSLCHLEATSHHSHRRPNGLFNWTVIHLSELSVYLHRCQNVKGLDSPLRMSPAGTSTSGTPTLEWQGSCSNSGIKDQFTCRAVGEHRGQLVFA